MKFCLNAVRRDAEIPSIRVIDADRDYQQAKRGPVQRERLFFTSVHPKRLYQSGGTRNSMQIKEAQSRHLCAFQKRRIEIPAFQHGKLFGAHLAAVGAQFFL